MFWTNVKRIARAGFVNFWRNGVVSFASVFVISVTLSWLGGIILMSAFLQASIGQIKDKVDINVYFKKDADVSEIKALTERLKTLPELKSIEYVSREEALAQFRERNKDNALIIQSLDELPDNPLGATLNIRAKEPSQYEGIAAFLNDQSERSISAGSPSIIDSINYQKNKLVIDRLTAIINGAEQLGMIVSLVLAVMAILVTFNTVRLAIYDSREEINVMKLVGAGHSYIRGPFIIEGLMYGLISSLIAMIALWPISYYFKSATIGFFGGFDLMVYYTRNFFQIFMILIGSGVVLGMLSTYFAIRRYLK